MRELTRRELQAETEDDIMVMVADTRTTILAGFVAGTAVTAGFIAAVVLVTGLWGVLQAFRFGMLVGLTGFVVLAAIVGLLSFFIPRFPTTRAVAGILVLTVAVIISVSVYVSDVAILPMAGRLLLRAMGGAVLLVVSLWYLVLLGGGCGALMALLQRRTAQQGGHWGLRFGQAVTIRTDPHVLLAVFTVPLMLAAVFGAAYYPAHSLAAVVFFSPFWVPSGFLFEQGWAPLLRLVLDARVGQKLWFQQSVALVRLLQSEDVLLLGAVFQTVTVDPATGVARIRGTFRNEAQIQRVQEVAQRVRGVKHAEIESVLPRASIELANLTLSERERMLAQRCPECMQPIVTDELFCRACDSFLQNELVGRKAKLFPRLLAVAIDAGVPAALLLMFVIQPVTPWAIAHPLNWFWRFIFAPALYASFYVSVLHSGTTPGKALLGLEIIDLRNHRYPRLPRMLLRELGGKLVSTLCLGIGFLWAIWNKDNQSLHDKLAGTVVVRNPDLW